MSSYPRLSAAATAIQFCVSFISCQQDQPSLVLSQTLGKLIKCEPAHFTDLDTAWTTTSAGPTAKHYFNLSGPLKYPNLKQLDRLWFQPDLFNQFTSQRRLWLLSCLQKSSRHAPTGSYAEPVLEQQHSFLFVEDDRTGSCRESRMSDTHAPKP